MIAAPAAVLAAGSILGRISCHVFFWELRGILRVEAEGKILRPKQLGYHGGGLTLPLEGGELEQLAAEATRTFAREAGAETFEEGHGISADSPSRHPLDDG